MLNQDAFHEPETRRAKAEMAKAGTKSASRPSQLMSTSSGKPFTGGVYVWVAVDHGLERTLCPNAHGQHGHAIRQPHERTGSSDPNRAASCGAVTAWRRCPSIVGEIGVVAPASPTVVPPVSTRHWNVRIRQDGHNARSAA